QFTKEAQSYRRGFTHRRYAEAVHLADEELRAPSAIEPAPPGQSSLRLRTARRATVARRPMLDAVTPAPRHGSRKLAAASSRCARYRTRGAARLVRLVRNAERRRLR